MSSSDRPPGADRTLPAEYSELVRAIREWHFAADQEPPSPAQLADREWLNGYAIGRATRSLERGASRAAADRGISGGD